MARSREILVFLAIALVALGLRLWFASGVQMVGSDEAMYLRMAEAIPGESIFTDLSHKYRPHPAYPFLMKHAIALGADHESLARWLSIVLGILTLIPLHLATRYWLGARAGLWACLLFALSPLAIEASLWILPRALFNLIWMLLLWCLLRGQCAKLALIWAVGTGAVLCALYMARPEGVVLAATLGLLGLCLPWRKGRVAYVLVAGLVFALLCAPFWTALWQETGRWGLSWTDEGGAFGLMRWEWYLQMGLPADQQATLMEIAKMYLTNCIKAWRLLPRMLPLLLWLFVSYGAVRAWQRKGGKSVLIGVGLALFPVFFYPLYVVEAGRWLNPAVLTVLPFAGGGLAALHDYWRPRWRMALPAMVLAVLICFALGYRNLWLGFAEEPLEQREMALWMKENVDDPIVATGTDRRAAYYIGPQCEKFIAFAPVYHRVNNPGAFEAFLREEALTHVLADSRYIRKYHGGLDYLLSEAPGAYLQRLHRVAYRGEELTLFRVIPENIGTKLTINSEKNKDVQAVAAPRLTP